MIPIKFRRFFKERRQWVKAGRPQRSLAKIHFLYDELCKPCEHFDNDQCVICGCRIKRNTRIMNKLAWATTHCPLEKPKWTWEVKPPEVEAEEKLGAEVNKPKVDDTKVDTKPKKRGCCG